MLKKLSLAALVAMGSMSVASATPLTDAIKGVSVNGFMRLRYYYHVDDNGGTTDYNKWQTNAKLVFGIPVAENMKIVWRVHAQTKVKGTDDKAKKTSLTDSLFFLNYANNGLAVNLGVVPLGALPYASSDEFTTAHGTGIVAMYNVQDGLTVVGGAVDWLNNVYASDERDALVIAGNNKLIENKKIDFTQPQSISNNIYTAGIIYSNDQYGNFQLWDYTAEDLIQNAFMIMADLNVLKDYGVSVNAEFGTSKLDDSVGNGNWDNHNYYKIAFGANVSGVDAEVGYAGTNDKTGVIVTSDDSKLGSIPTELVDNVANMTDVDVWFAKLGYDIDEKTKVWANFASIDQSDDAGNVDSTEFDVEGSYKFNKKFGVSGYYAYIDYDNANYDSQQEVKVQFKYSF